MKKLQSLRLRIIKILFNSKYFVHTDAQKKKPTLGGLPF